LLQISLLRLIVRLNKKSGVDLIRDFLFDKTEPESG